jgi:hypothetical protein
MEVGVALIKSGIATTTTMMMTMMMVMLMERPNLMVQ